MRDREENQAEVGAKPGCSCAADAMPEPGSPGSPGAVPKPGSPARPVPCPRVWASRPRQQRALRTSRSRSNRYPPAFGKEITPGNSCNFATTLLVIAAGAVPCVSRTLLQGKGSFSSTAVLALPLGISTVINVGKLKKGVAREKYCISVNYKS